VSQLSWALGCFSQQGFDVTKSVEIMLAPFLSLHWTRVKASCQQYNKYTCWTRHWKRETDIFSSAQFITHQLWNHSGLEVNDSCTFFFLWLPSHAAGRLHYESYSFFFFCFVSFMLREFCTPFSLCSNLRVLTKEWYKWNLLNTLTRGSILGSTRAYSKSVGSRIPVWKFFLTIILDWQL